MKLNDKHIENLRALLAVSERGMLRSKTPHPRQIQYLANHGLVEVRGVDWISHTTITDEGRNAVKELDDAE